METEEEKLIECSLYATVMFNNKLKKEDFFQFLAS